MVGLFPSDKIYVSQSKITDAGRGVFAKVTIEKGEIVESCPVIEIPKHEASIVNKSSLVNYIYYFGKNKDRMRIVLGFGSLYNHSYSPNAKYRENLKRKTVDFVAKKMIKKGEEITVNYSPKTKIPLWFEV